MGLVDKLTELDEYIWKQHEKVTQYCNKEYGWDKYDLARKSNKGMAVSWVGSATYSALEGVLGSSPSFVGAGIFSLAVAGASYYFLEQFFQRHEKMELKRLECNTMSAPHFLAWRPIVLPLAALTYAIAGIFSFLGYSGVPESLKISQEQYHLLNGLDRSFYASTHVFLTSTLYFADQIMTPPKKKRSVLKTLYEKAKGKLEPVSVPQLEPVKPTRYQSIDEVIGE